jgi:hypothetical protein
VTALLWERAVAVAPGLQDGADWAAARVPAGVQRALGGGGATFFPVRSSRAW